MLLEGAVGTAIAVNELPAQRARAVWAAIREGACYKTLDARLKLWVDLFAAVGARDANGMSDAGTRALETAPNPFARDYALSAAAAAEISLKRPALADRLLAPIRSRRSRRGRASCARRAPASRSRRNDIYIAARASRP